MRALAVDSVQFVSDWPFLVGRPKDALSAFIDTISSVGLGVGTHITRFEKHPVIEMKLLVDAGLFARRGRSSITIRHHIPYRVTHSLRGMSLLVEFIVDLQYQSQLIELEYSSARFGGRIRFICPRTGRICTKLHLYGDSFMSRRAHPGISVREGSPRQRRYEHVARLRDRLLGRDGKGPARGANRLRLIVRLLQSEIAFEVWPDLRRVALDSVETAMRRRGQPALGDRVGPNATAAAWEAGRTLTPGDDIHWLSNAVEQPSGLSEPRDKGALEDHFGLDLNTLLTVSHARTDQLWAHTLVWQTDRETVELAVMVNWSQLEIQITDTSSAILDPVPQRIRLIRSHSRYRFCCPISGKACDVLFLRDGRFASRTAQKLEYRSQIGRRRVRKSRAKPAALPPVPEQSAEEKEAEEWRRMHQPVAIPDDATPYEMAHIQMWNRLLRDKKDAILYFLRLYRFGWDEIERPEILAGYYESEFADELRAAEAGRLFDSRGFKIPNKDRR